MGQTKQRLVWGLTAVLAALYIGGFFLGWAAGYASWHLLLVVVAILFLYGALSQREA